MTKQKKQTLPYAVAERLIKRINVRLDSCDSRTEFDILVAEKARIRVRTIPQWIDGHFCTGDTL